MAAVRGTIGPVVYSLRKKQECHPCFYSSPVESTLLVFFWYDVLSCSCCCRQYTCAVTCWYWYECKHIRDGRGSRYIMQHSSTAFENRIWIQLWFRRVCIKLSCLVFFFFFYGEFMMRTILSYMSNARGRLAYCIKRAEFSFSSLVMHQIAPTQQPKQQQ